MVEAVRREWGGWVAAKDVTTQQASHVVGGDNAGLVSVLRRLTRDRVGVHQFRSNQGELCRRRQRICRLMMRSSDRVGAENQVRPVVEGGLGLILLVQRLVWLTVMLIWIPLVVLN